MLKGWLIEIANDLRGMEINSSYVNGRRMCSVLIILYLLHKLSDHLLEKGRSTTDEILMLFSMLRLQPDVSKSECPDLHFLLRYIPNDIIKEVAKVLVHFFNQVSPHVRERAEWFYVIPLIHVFMHKVEPFDDPPEIDLKRMVWDHKIINLNRTAVSQ